MFYFRLVECYFFGAQRPYCVGSGVAIIAAMLWLTTPLFWFHGCVNAIYAEEAFFTSLLLYLGLKVITNYKLPRMTDHQRMTDHERMTNKLPHLAFVIFYSIAFSLAGAARPTSLLFFLRRPFSLSGKKSLPKTFTNFDHLFSHCNRHLGE